MIQITNLLITILDFILCIKFESLFFKSSLKKTRKIALQITALFALFSFGFIKFNSYFLNILFYDIIYFIFFCFYFNKPNLFKLWITLIIEGIVYAIPGTVIYYLLQYLHKNYSIVFTSDGIAFNTYLMYIFLFFLMSALEYIDFKKKKVIRNPHEPIVSSYLFTSTFFLLCIADNYTNQKQNVIFIVIFIYLFITFLLLYFLFKKITEHTKKEYDLKLALDLSNLTLDYEAKLKENTLLLKSLRHDLKNHLIVIEGYIKSEEQKKALNYIHSISSETISSNMLINTPSIPLSALLSNKKQLCIEKGISFTPEIITSSSLIPDMDLCIVVGNLLDNAIEAAEQVENRNAYIDFSMQARNDILHIICYNNFLIKPVLSHGTLLTHKQRQKIFHGIGLKNVKKLVEKYNGTMNYSFTEDIFTIEILLKL